MIKLIMADIKVLGHRIWTIPLGVFLFIMMFSFIPYLDQVQAFQNWIFAILIPGLLTYESLREEQKNNTNNMLMTMPMSKEVYVWSKYVVIVGFVILGISAGVFAQYFIDFFNLKNVDPVDNRYFKDMYYSSLTTMNIILYILPIYFYLKKIRIVFFLAPILMFVIYYLNHNAYKILIYNTIFPRNYFSTAGTIYFGSIDYVFNILNLVIILLLIHTVIKYRFKSISNTKLMNGWFLILTSVSITATEIIFEKLQWFNWYLRRKRLCIEHATRWSSQKMDDMNYGNKFANFLEYMLNECTSEENALIILSIIIVISFLTMLIIHQTTKDKFFQIAVLFLMMPIVTTIFGEYIIHILHQISIDRSFLDSTMISTIIFFIISVKASIYLLKNNRTLK